MEIKLYNSLTKDIEPFSPVDGDTVRMYSCGPTVYNFAHIGNMRAFLFADLLQRVIRSVGGYKVKWVMNITDIDDKTIRDSAYGSPAWLPEMGEQSNDGMENLSKLTKYYTNAFFDDISSLGIDLSDFESIPRATEYIPQMQELIIRILKHGFAYISQGSVYFDVNKWRSADHYGKLFHIDFEHFKAGVRIDADQYEREQVSDFVLWKTRKEGEPYWDFEIDNINCPGRPGWHIECSAMEFELLGLPFDIHTGGIDLKFPHHEDEIAQSKAGYGIEPTVFWCHNEFLEVEGQKMSKSLGNYFTLRDLINKGIDPLDIRFSMLSAHYASKFNFTMDGLSSSHKARVRIQDYIYSLFDESTNENLSDIDILDLEKRVSEDLASDLHTPKALGNVFTFINHHPPENLTPKAKGELKSFFRFINSIFHVWKIEKRPDIKVEIPQEVIILAEARIQAKKDKNYAEADSLRLRIQDLGYMIKDSKEGYTLEKI